MMSDLTLIQTKTCSRCKLENPLDEFNKNKSTKDGYYHWCKKCLKEYREANKERIAERNKRYREANKEKVSGRKKQWYEANKERVSDRMKQWYEANKERVLTQRSQYWDAHKRQITEYKNHYYHTPGGFATRKWNQINKRTINGSSPHWGCKSHRHYLNKGIKLLITKNELKQFVTDNWSKITAMWEKGQTPSIDRIDSDGHYSLDNIQFIPLRENCRRAGNQKSK